MVRLRMSVRVRVSLGFTDRVSFSVRVTVRVPGTNRQPKIKTEIPLYFSTKSQIFSHPHRISSLWWPIAMADYNPSDVGQFYNYLTVIVSRKLVTKSSSKVNQNTNKKTSVITKKYLLGCLLDRMARSAFSLYTEWSVVTEFMVTIFWI